MNLRQGPQRQGQVFPLPMTFSRYQIIPRLRLGFASPDDAGSSGLGI